MSADKEFHWCPHCETKNLVDTGSETFTGQLQCWKCDREWNIERSSNPERLRDSILSAHGLMGGSQLGRPAKDVTEANNQ